MNPPTINKPTRESFEAFIANGGTTEAGLRMFYTSGELRGMLDLARSEILQHRAGTSAPTACAGPNGKDEIAKMEATLAECRAAKAKAAPGAAMPLISCLAGKAQAARAAAKAPARPATTAAPTMNRSEFDKLTHPQRNAFIRDGGRLSD
jgi:hypothetical protein